MLSAALTLGIRNLRRRRARHFLTGLSVFLPVAFFTFYASVQAQLWRLADMANKAGIVVVIPSTSRGTMTLAQRRPITELPNVVGAVTQYPMLAFDKQTRYRWVVLAVTDNYFEISGAASGGDFDWFMTTPENIEAWKRERTGAVIGPKTAETMGWKVGDQVQLPTHLGPIPVKIVALGELGLNQTHTITHYEYFEEYFKLEGSVNMYILRTQDYADVEPTIRAVDELFVSSPNPTQSLSDSDFQQSNVGEFQFLPNLLGAVGTLFLLLTILVTTNTVRMSVAERISEIGTLRAVGFRRSTIAMMVIGETMAVCGTAALLGAGVPFLLFNRGFEVGAWVLERVPMRELPTLIALALGLLVGLLASLVPAIQASRLEVVDAIRPGA